jgi:hypothetical protein
MIKLKELRELPITSAIKISTNAYVYSGQNVIFIVPADDILNWTASTVTVRLKQLLVTYNNMGSQTSLVPLKG